MSKENLSLERLLQITQIISYYHYLLIEIFLSIAISEALLASLSVFLLFKVPGKEKVSVL